MTEPTVAVSTSNDALVMTGANLPNHTTSAMGLGKWVRIGSHTPTIFRTRQEAWRAVAWILALVEKHGLPDEKIDDNGFELPGPDGLLEILTAVHKQIGLDLAPLMLSLTTGSDVEDEEEE